MKTIEQLWELLKDVELIQVRPVEMEALYKIVIEKPDPLVVEIGSAHGASSIILAEAVKEKYGQLICIDSFPEDYYDQDKFGEYAKKAFKKNVLDKYKNVKFLNMTSKEASEKIESITRVFNKIDLLFVDGDHSYEGVADDIRNYLHLIEDKGYIAFHDYYNPAFGVRQAVDEFITDNFEGPTQYWDLAVYKKI